MKRLIRETHGDGVLHEFITSHTWDAETGNRITLDIPEGDMRDKEYRSVIKFLKNHLAGDAVKAVSKIVDSKANMRLILIWKDDVIADDLYYLRIYSVTKRVTAELYRESTLINWFETI